MQDTLKTYCTEDTPYETPFNCSSATSMSDLRLDDKPQLLLAVELENGGKSSDGDCKNVTKLNDVRSVVVENTIANNDDTNKTDAITEKPVNYCEEGTPGGCISRAPSFTSLSSIAIVDSDPPPSAAIVVQAKTEDTEVIVLGATAIMVVETVAGQQKEEEEEQLQQQATNSIQQQKSSSGGGATTEIKAVKFEDVVNYAEETPLMFSRSSSLASLDSIEQHSIHDDLSSVVSDFR